MRFYSGTMEGTPFRTDGPGNHVKPQPKQLLLPAPSNRREEARARLNKYKSSAYPERGSFSSGATSSGSKFYAGTLVGTPLQTANAVLPANRLDRFLDWSAKGGETLLRKAVSPSLLLGAAGLYGAVKGGLSVANKIAKEMPRLSQRNFGSGNPLYTQQAATERSRAESVIFKNHTNASVYLGSEASKITDRYR